MKLQATTLSQLSAMFGINLKTLKNWLKPYPHLLPKPGQRLLTPKQVQMIFDQFGKPEQD